jgi:Gas vesicle synthesis protein GvpL/GvpF
VSLLYLYAILGELPRRPPGPLLRLTRLDGLWVAARLVGSAPAPTEAALRAHDAIVRRLAAAAEAVLPFRFGSVVADASQLARELRPRLGRLREALALVTGREQMTLRVYGAPRRQAGRRRTIAAGRGPGARYLARRARAHAVPEIDPIRPALATLVRAELAERHDVPPLVASVYHLVDRGRGPAYRAALRRAAGAAPGIRLRVTGPWPPYAFAAEPA